MSVDPTVGLQLEQRIDQNQHQLFAEPAHWTCRESMMSSDHPMGVGTWDISDDISSPFSQWMISMYSLILLITRYVLGWGLFGVTPQASRDENAASLPNLRTDQDPPGQFSNRGCSQQEGFINWLGPGLGLNRLLFSAWCFAFLTSPSCLRLPDFAFLTSPSWLRLPEFAFLTSPSWIRLPQFAFLTLPTWLCFSFLRWTIICVSGSYLFDRGLESAMFAQIKCQSLFSTHYT